MSLSGRLLCLLILLTSLSAQAQFSRRQLQTPWQFTQDGQEAWLPAMVPGTVHTDLLAHKKIEDPFYRDNEKKLQWIEERNWRYRTQFNLSAKDLANRSLELVFTGLDTYAEVYLNGEGVAYGNNMFRSWRVDLKRWGRPGQNKLEIRFLSPRLIVPDQIAKLGYMLPANNDDSEVKMAPFVRKAQYHFGWDWGPRYVTAGIWRPVYIEAAQAGSISHTQFNTVKASADSARIKGRVTIRPLMRGTAKVLVRINKQLHTFEQAVDSGQEVDIPLTFAVSKPQLWWPHTLGKPHLYELSTEVSINGKSLGARSQKLGIRTVGVKHEYDKAGKSLTVMVNGKPVFCKGANYIPQDNFLPRVPAAKYEKLIADAKAANMNMLRVWGGGIYENDIFYDLCDREGILVWQDFMFACAMYPGDEEFISNVTAEAVENVQRLGSHACLALWCGNNENEQGWHQRWWNSFKKWGPQDSVKIWEDYKLLFGKVLPAVVAANDPGKFYHSSSPSANEFRADRFNISGWGDKHDWAVWFSRVRFDAYKKNVGRFVSEYGFQSFPTHEMIEQFTEPEDRQVESKVMLAHQKHQGGNDKINNRWMAWYYRKPRDFDQFLYMSSLLQADAMKMGLEVHRYNKPHNWGSLYWQINDCWPAVSWSSIDYSGRWKATQYIAAKANQNVIVVPEGDKDSLRIHVVNDLLTAVDSRMVMSLYDFNGKQLKREEVKRRLDENESARLMNLAVARLLPGGLADTARVICRTELFDQATGKLLHDNYYYFTDPKHMDLPEAEIKVTPIKQKGSKEAWVQVSTNTLARGVYLRHSGSGRFSDNYFDLLPGQPRIIKFIPEPGKKKGPKIKEVISSLKIYQVATSYDRKLKPARK